jgi:hypothetical protein
MARVEESRDLARPRRPFVPSFPGQAPGEPDLGAADVAKDLERGSLALGVGLRPRAGVGRQWTVLGLPRVKAIGQRCQVRPREVKPANGGLELIGGRRTALCREQGVELTPVAVGLEEGRGHALHDLDSVRVRDGDRFPMLAEPRCVRPDGARDPRECDLLVLAPREATDEVEHPGSRPPIVVAGLDPHADRGCRLHEIDSSSPCLCDTPLDGGRLGGRVGNVPAGHRWFTNVPVGRWRLGSRLVGRWRFANVLAARSGDHDDLSGAPARGSPGRRLLRPLPVRLP